MQKITAPSLVPVADPEAAAACHRAGVGQEVHRPRWGHRLDPRWGKPVIVTGTVTRLSDGRFRYIGGIWDGVEGNMGPIGGVDNRRNSGACCYTRYL